MLILTGIEMDLLDEFLRLISTPNDIPPSSYSSSYVYIMIFHLIPFVLGLLLMIRFVIVYIRSIPQNRSFIQPLLYGIVSVTGLSITNFLVALIRWYFDNSRSLLRSAASQTLWFVIITYTIIPVFNRYIKMPEARQKRLRRIIFYIRASTFVGILIFIIAFFGLDLGTTIGNLVILISSILMVRAVFLIRDESKDNISKLVKIRLSMLTLGYLPIALTFLALPILITFLVIFSGNLYLSNLSQIVWAFFSTSMRVISTLGFYWVFFIPDWIRKRFDLYHPRINEVFGDKFIAE